MAGTDRQKKKFQAFDVECTRLAAEWVRHAEAYAATGDSPVNILAATKALNRYRHHKASIMAPGRDFWNIDTAAAGRAHVVWARVALRQAAKLLGVESLV